jgi:UDP-glucuronate decarboxylase
LARLIISLVGSRSWLEFRTLPPDDPRQRYPDATCANQLPHGSPRVPFEEGLERASAYFDGLLSSPSEAKRVVWKVTL